jgi:hypothetical protein
VEVRAQGVSKEYFGSPYPADSRRVVRALRSLMPRFEVWAESSPGNFSWMLQDLEAASRDARLIHRLAGES